MSAASMWKVLERRELPRRGPPVDAAVTGSLSKVHARSDSLVEAHGPLTVNRGQVMPGPRLLRDLGGLTEARATVGHDLEAPRIADALARCGPKTGSTLPAGQL